MNGYTISNLRARLVCRNAFSTFVKQRLVSRVYVAIAILLVGFLTSFAGHLGAIFMAGGAPWLAAITGLVTLGFVIPLGLWAARRV